MNTDKTLYSTLQVSENASDEVIRAAYLSLVKKFHPDGNPAFRNEATAITTELNYAYSILSDHAKRSFYDARLHEYRNSCNTSTYKTASPIKETHTNKKRKSSKKWAISFVLFIAIICIGHSFRPRLGIGSQTTNLNTPPPKEKTEYHVGRPDVKNTHEIGTAHLPPAHGYFLEGGNLVTYRDHYVGGPYDDELYAPFTINPPKDDTFYLVKLKNIWNPDIVYQIFIHGEDEPIEVNLLCGTYHLSYATGSEWYGENDLFGNENRCYKAHDSFRFYHDKDIACGHTLTLYAVPNGNLSFEEISSDDF